MNSLPTSRWKSSVPKYCQYLRNIERLEDRLVLSAALPTVTNISLASTDWTTAFYDYLDSSGLGSDGYSIPDGSSAQQDTLSWNNLNQIRVSFSEDVYVNAEDLSLSGVNQTSYEISDFSYTPEDATAVWTFSSPLSTDRFMLDLDSDGVNPITDLDGNLLDGEWINSVSTYANSGNGIAGGDFEFLFNVLPGDTLNLEILDFNNMFAIYQRVGLDTQDSMYEESSDIDGDGIIENSDWQEVYNNLWETLPTGDPEGVFNDAPTSIGFDAVEIFDDAIDHAISLYNVFDDAEDTDAQMTYQVVSNDSPTLFDSVTIDMQTGELILNTKSGVSGRAELEIKATDQNGLSVMSTLQVDVDRQNDIPSIINVTTTDAGYDRWIIEGWVTDNDNVLDDMYVSFIGNYIFERVSVAVTGYFHTVVLLDPGQEDYIDIYVANDGSGASSNIVNVEIG